MHAGTGIGEVVADGWLVVGPGGDQLEPLAPEFHRLAEVTRARPPSAELVGIGWHRHPGVLREQRDEAADIAAFVGVDEPADDLGFPAGTRERDPLPVASRAEAGPGALQRAVNRRWGRTEDLRRLGGREPEHVAKDQG